MKKLILGVVALSFITVSGFALAAGEKSPWTAIRNAIDDLQAQIDESGAVLHLHDADGDDLGLMLSRLSVYHEASDFFFSFNRKTGDVDSILDLGDTRDIEISHLLFSELDCAGDAHYKNPIGDPSVLLGELVKVNALDAYFTPTTTTANPSETTYLSTSTISSVTCLNTAGVTPPNQGYPLLEFTFPFDVPVAIPLEVVEQ